MSTLGRSGGTLPWAAWASRCCCRPGDGLARRWGVFIAVAAGCAGLYAYALVRYPGLDNYAAAWVCLAILLPILVGYTLAGSALVRRPGVAAPGLAGGLFVLAAWLVLDGVTARQSSPCSSRCC